MEEFDYNTHWINYQEWALEVGLWKKEAPQLEKSKTKIYLGATQVSKFEGFKEEVTHFIISPYHACKTLLDEPVEINVKLIKRIIQNKGHGILKTTNTKK
jgi:hypothetical protein